MIISNLMFLIHHLIVDVSADESAVKPWLSSVAVSYKPTNYQTTVQQLTANAK